MLKIKTSWNAMKLERTRIYFRFESVALNFAKNGLRMLPKMSFLRLHKHAKKWWQGVQTTVCTTGMACWLGKVNVWSNSILWWMTSCQVAMFDWLNCWVIWHVFSGLNLDQWGEDTWCSLGLPRAPPMVETNFVKSGHRHRGLTQWPPMQHAHQLPPRHTKVLNI